MNRTWMKMWTLAMVGGFLLMAGGCNNNRLKQERDELYAQNVELQDRLAQTQAALDECEADRMRMTGEMESLRVTAVAPPVPVAADTGFEGIGGIETFENNGMITVRIPGDVLFAPGKVDLRSSAIQTLDDVIGVIRREYPGNTVRVMGYTDTDPIKKSKWTDNLELSLHRSAAVHRHLQKRGLDPTLLEAVGLGPWHPRSTKALSRRVEIVVVR